jgi:CheY-like chemotaxis protein
VLVADDDPASCRFLGDGLRSLGARVVICRNGREARERARAETFDLLLLDCRMPGAGALQILRQLRDDPLAASIESVAVATSAELEPCDRQSLLAAGFIDILCKPCTVGDLQRLLTLLSAGLSESPVLDDRAALTSSGDATTMRALRLLLREELALLLQELERLGLDPVGLGDRLHRLRSSCGFCGAAALASEAMALQRQMASGSATPDSLTRFRKALLTTLQALDR